MKDLVVLLDPEMPLVIFLVLFKIEFFRRLLAKDTVYHFFVVSGDISLFLVDSR